ncbi:MAG: SH3 beta-barrel fold-containing protein [Bacteroides sp.]|nr:SH3 beta-barrel fold-containing protein [Bacteroides sp.]
MKTKIETLREVMHMAWQFIKRNGFTMSEALRQAWAVIKLRVRLSSGIIRFYFRKVDGTIREAWGTLASDRVPETKGSNRKLNDTLQTYFDTEVGEWRSFKKVNLITE